MFKETDDATETWWFECSSKVEEVSVTGTEKSVRKTIKERCTGTAKES